MERLRSGGFSSWQVPTLSSLRPSPKGLSAPAACDAPLSRDSRYSRITNYSFCSGKEYFTCRTDEAEALVPRSYWRTTTTTSVPQLCNTMVGLARDASKGSHDTASTSQATKAVVLRRSIVKKTHDTAGSLRAASRQRRLPF